MAPTFFPSTRFGGIAPCRLCRDAFSPGLIYSEQDPVRTSFQRKPSIQSFLDVNCRIVRETQMRVSRSSTAMNDSSGESHCSCSHRTRQKRSSVDDADVE